MPPRPQGAEVGGGERVVEVFDQVIPQDTRHAQGDVTAAGEIHVQLHGEQKAGHRKVRAAHGFRRGKDKADILGQVVGNDHLFHVAPQDAEQPARTAAVAEPPRVLDLRAQVGVALNGAGDHRREKADEHGIVQKIRLHAAALAEHVDRVAQRREREIAQPQRREQVKVRHARAGQPGHGVGQQVPVFVVQQNADPARQRQQQKQHPHGLYTAFADDEPAQPCNQRSARQHSGQRAVFRCITVKSVVGGQEKIRPHNARQQIVQKSRRRKKAQIRQGKQVVHRKNLTPQIPANRWFSAPCARFGPAPVPAPARAFPRSPWPGSAAAIFPPAGTAQCLRTAAPAAQSRTSA